MSLSQLCQSELWSQDQAQTGRQIFILEYQNKFLVSWKDLPYETLPSRIRSLISFVCEVLVLKGELGRPSEEDSSLFLFCQVNMR